MNLQEERLLFLNQVKDLNKYLFNEPNSLPHQLKLKNCISEFLDMLRNSNYSRQYIFNIISKLRKELKLIDCTNLITKNLRFTTKEYNSEKIKQNVIKNYKNNNKKSINYNEYISMTEALLNTDNAKMIYIGLLMATGRRPSEILIGDIKLDSDKTLLFKGQLKTNISRHLEYFTIPSFIDNNLIYLRFQYLKQSKFLQDALLASNRENYLKPVDYIIKALFEGKIVKPDFRAIYTLIILTKEKYFSPYNNKDIDQRIKEILNHNTLGSVQSNYKDFCLTYNKDSNYYSKIDFIASYNKLLINKEELNSLINSDYKYYKTIVEIVYRLLKTDKNTSCFWNMENLRTVIMAELSKKGLKNQKYFYKISSRVFKNFKKTSIDLFKRQTAKS